jgi:hypothetical protein
MYAEMIKDQNQFYTNSNLVSENYSAQVATSNAQLNKDLADIHKQQLVDHTITQDQANQLELAKRAEHNEQIKQLTAKLRDDLALTVSNNGSVMDQLSYGAEKWAKTTVEASRKVGGAMAQVAQMAMNSLGHGIGNAFKAMGQAMAEGQSVWGAFMTQMQAMLSQMASDAGQYFIMLGLASLWTNPAGGAGMIAGGMALMLLSGLLAPSGGASAPTSSAASSSSFAGPSSTSTLPDSTNQQTRQEAQTVLNVHIQGDVLDSSDTGHRIFEILANKFNLDGSTLPAGITA